MQIQKSDRIKILVGMLFTLLLVPLWGQAQTAVYLPSVHQKAQREPERRTQDSLKKQMEEYQEQLFRREQDSLKRLLDTGHADTIRYRYEQGYLLGKRSEYGIKVIPRVDLVENQIADNSTSIASWSLLLLTMVLVFFCSKLIIKNLYKEKPDYLFPYIACYLLGGGYIYFILSCFYCNFDDIMIRKYGEEKMAVLDNDSIRYILEPKRSGYAEFDASSDYFIFTDANGVQIAVNQGNTKFQRSNHKATGNDTFVKVRYDAASRKLAVDDKQYFMQNVNVILCMCLLVILFLLFACGKFNWLFDRINRRIKKSVENQNQKILKEFDYEPFKPKQYLSYPEEYSTVDCYWTLSSETYQSMSLFFSAVNHFERQEGFEEDNRLDPYKKLPNLPGVSITISDERIIAGENLKLEIRADNGKSMTAGELLFKVHHQLIPYHDKLLVHSIWGLAILGRLEGEELIACSIFFGFDIFENLEDDGEE